MPRDLYEYLKKHWKLIQNDKILSHIFLEPPVIGYSIDNIDYVTGIGNAPVWAATPCCAPEVKIRTQIQMRKQAQAAK